MRELLASVLGQLRGTWRFRWYALLVAWAVAVVGGLGVLAMPDQYRVQSRVQLDTQSMLRPLLKDLAVEPDLQMRMQALTATLLRRENLERIASENELLLEASTQAQEERILDGLEQQIRIQQTQQDQIYRIEYTASSPQKARGVVQSVVDILMEETQSATIQDATTANEFLERQVKEYEDRLQEAEQRLAEFKRDNVGLLPNEGGGDFYQRLNQTEEEIEGLESDLETAQRRKQSLEQRIARLKSGQANESQASPRVKELSDELRASRQRLDELLTRYTEQHPDVRALQDRMERQKQRLEELRNQSNSSQSTADVQNNPVYQEFQLRLNEIESEIASLKTRLQRKKQRREELLAKVDEITQVEAKLQDLTRNYESIKQRYETLLERLQTARMTSEADRSAGQMNVRLVDPPRTPSEPDGPPRALLLLAAAPLSLGMGTAFAFLLHLVRPVFQNREDLSEVTGRPVIGSVSLVLTQRQQRAKLGDLTIYGMAAMTLIVAMGIAAMYADIGAEQMQELMRRLEL